MKSFQSNFSKLLLFFLFLPQAIAEDGDQIAIDRCISNWEKSPFKKGQSDYKVLESKVNVFGIGGDIEDLTKTSEPKLILIKPGVNVLGKMKYRLMNPNGWYCFKGSVSVLGKIQVDLHCDAELASKSAGTDVLGATDKKQGGVSVLGSIRMNRVKCD